MEDNDILSQKKEENNTSKDDPFLRNAEANADIFIGGDTRLLAEKRLTAIKKSRKKTFSESPNNNKLSSSSFSSNELSSFDNTTETKWIQLGPTTIPDGQTYSRRDIRVLVSGRVTAIAPHPQDANIIYLGAAQGGVWKTTDGGRNWKAKSDNLPSLAIGALAIDESNPLVVYAGTGEGNFSTDSQYGMGIIKTVDGGENWELKGLSTFFTSRFCRLAVNRNKSSTIFAAATSSPGSNAASGVYRSNDGGDNWSRMNNLLPPIDTLGATDIVLDPNNSDIAYAAFWGDGIYKTNEANLDNPRWNKISNGLPAATDITRIVLGISKSSPNTLYALMANSKRIIDKFYYTNDGGSTWKRITLPGVRFSGKPYPDSIGVQGTYNINLAVNPQNKDIVYLSGMSLWKAIYNSSNDSWKFFDVGEDIHPDNHAFAFNHQNPRIIYAGNDGGIYQSNDEGSTWIDSINEGLCITQFTFMEQHPTSDSVILSGTQDNGTVLYRNSPACYHSADGDGGFCAIDHIKTNNYFHTFYGPDPALSTRAGNFVSWRRIKKGLPPFENPDGSRNSLFYPPIALDKTNPNNIAFGGDILYLDNSQGLGGWQEHISLPNRKGFVSAINYVNSNLIYVATFGGSVYRLTKSINQWNAHKIESNAWPERPIWDVITLPNDNTKIIIILSGFNTGPNNPHIFYVGVPQQGEEATWTDISGTGENRIPDAPVNALVIEDDNQDIMYIGMDAGVWRTTDGGKNWTPFNQGLPNTQVYDMRLHSDTRLLRVVTHGRGIWQIKLDTETMNNVNIFLRDNVLDTGVVAPSPTDADAIFEDEYQGITLGQKLKWHMCPDIKIDSPAEDSTYQMDIEDVDYVKFEHKLFNRNIKRGKTNRIYLQVHNRGVKDVTQATIKILYCNNTNAWPNLPSDFWTQFPENSQDIFNWKPIGEPKVLPSLPKTLTFTEPTIVSWEWMAPLDLSENIGMLAVIDSIDDPLPQETKTKFAIDSLVPNEKRVGVRILKVAS